VSTWSFEHVADTRAALRSIVSDPAYGATALSNVRVMSEVLPRMLRGAKLERAVLVTAAKESLSSTMLKHVSEGMDPVLAVRLSANFLAEISAVPIEACYWVAAELALALGLISPDQADELGSRETSAPAESSAPLDQSGLLDDVSVAERSAGRVEAPAPDAMPAQPPAARPPVEQPAARPAQWAAQGATPAWQGAPPGQAGYAPGPAADYAAGPAAGYAAPGAGGPQPVPQADDWISRVVRDTVHPGLLAFNPPAEMQQGRPERIEVGIARSPELRDALTAGLRGRGVTEVLQVDAGPVMGVELRGSSFQVTPLSPIEQLVVPLARWEFDITPLRSGSQKLTLCVSIRIDAPFPGGGRIAVPVLERDIRIHVNVVYGARRFVANNWQWLVGTAIALGGGIAAWISLVH